MRAADLSRVGPGGRAQTAAPPLADLSRSLQELSAKVSPSVVQIFVTGYAAPDEENRVATGEPQLERSSGSGVIVDPDGYIVTNAHVVENATRVEVELPFDATGGAPGRSILKRRGRIGGRAGRGDRSRDRHRGRQGRGARSAGAAVRRLRCAAPGQLVLAFGSPLGLDSSVTMGVVSAVARQLTPDDPMIYIQTDAPINPGNSGGALVDTEGRLVGINTLIYTQSGGSEGIGFAAPSNIVRNVFAQIRKYGRVRRGEIGVSTQTITPLMAEALGLTFDAGVMLADVTPGGPAAKAGPRARRHRALARRQADGERAAVPDQRLHARHRRAGRDRGPPRQPLADRPGAGGGARERHRPVRGAHRIAAGDSDPRRHCARSHASRRASCCPSSAAPKGAVVARVLPDTPYSQQGKLEVGDVDLRVQREADQRRRRS